MLRSATTCRGHLHGATAVAVLALTLIFPGTSGAQERDPCAGAPRPTAKQVFVPSSQHRTLQSAVCAVVDGGKVHVLPGTYSGPITIWGKHVELRGTGHETDERSWPVLQMAVPQEVVSSRAAVAIISVRAGGSLTAKMLRFLGGDAGIRVDEPSGDVDVTHATFEQNGRGILFLSSASLTIKHVAVTNSLWNGISYVPPALVQTCGSFDVSHATLGFTGNAGIYVRRCITNVDHTSFNFNDGGGIVAIESGVAIDDVDIDFSTPYGILVLNSSAVIDHTDINFTHATQGGFLGDAITVWTLDGGSFGGVLPSKARLKNVTTFQSDRAAVSSFGGHVAAKNCTFQCQSFDIGAEKSVPGNVYEATFDDQGGVLCGCPLLEHCLAKSYELEPPPPVGGLE